MAEYCSKCTPFFEADYKLFWIALKLKKGRSFNVLCEGCNVVAIYKDENRKLYLGRKVDGEVKLEPVNIDDLM